MMHPTNTPGQGRGNLRRDHVVNETARISSELERLADELQRPELRDLAAKWRHLSGALMTVRSGIEMALLIERLEEQSGDTLHPTNSGTLKYGRAAIRDKCIAAMEKTGREIATNPYDDEPELHDVDPETRAPWLNDVVFETRDAFQSTMPEGIGDLKELWDDIGRVLNELRDCVQRVFG